MPDEKYIIELEFEDTRIVQCAVDDLPVRVRLLDKDTREVLKRRLLVAHYSEKKKEIVFNLLGS